MQGRRHFSGGLLALALAGLGSAKARAQYYQQPGYAPPPPRYSDQEEEEHRRYEERRREEEARRREYYEQHGRPGSVVGLEEERNRRVLALQLQLQRGQIGRRQFDEQVAEVDRELHDRLGQ